MTLFHGLTFGLGIGLVAAGIILTIVGICTGKDIGDKMVKGSISFMITVFSGFMILGTFTSYKITDDRYLQAVREVFPEKALTERDGYYILNTFDEGKKISRVKSIVSLQNIEQNEKNNANAENDDSKTDISSVEKPKTESQEINYCPNCGAKNDGYKFCPQCGEKLS